MKIKIRKQPSVSHHERNLRTARLVGASFLTVLVGIIILNSFGNAIFTERLEYVAERPGNNVTPGQNVMVGSRAPGFAMKTLNNGTMSNLNFAGSPLVLVFWTTWNQLSSDQLKIIDDYMAKPSHLPFYAVAVNSQEDKDLVASFIKRGGYKIPVVLDSRGSMGEAYGAHNFPAVYFIDSNGVVEDSFIGLLDEAGFVLRLEQLVK